MGAELPKCCTVSAYIQEMKTDMDDAKPDKFEQEAQQKAQLKIMKPHKHNTINTKTTHRHTHTSSKSHLKPSLKPYNSTPSGSKPHRRRSKKKKKSQHHTMKLKYKREKRAHSHSMQYYNDTTTDTDEEHNEILSATYHLLNEQNQLFIGKHAAYFAETYDMETIRSIDSGDSVYSITPTSAQTLTPTSPLCTLSGNHASIILSYSDFTFPGSTKRSRSSSVPMPIDEDHQLNYFKSTVKCDCVETCVSIERIVDALECYVLKDFAHIDLKHLVSDYQHILNDHLSQELEINMGMEYALIKNKIDTEIGRCNIRKCDGHKRYKQSKEYKIDTGDAFLMFMDSMHCFFMHSQDL